MATAIVDLKEENGKYHITSIQEEVGDRFKKFCLNPNCYVFGLISSEEMVNKFLEKNPEFRLKARKVVVEGNVLDIVEIKEEVANIKRLANSGDHKAQYELGQMYEEGSSSGEAGQSLDLAIKYYQMAKDYVPEAKQRLKELIKVYGIVRDSCPICLEKFNIGNNFCSTFCGHQFHMGCLIDVMKTRNTCPVCRKDLGFKCKKEEEKKEVANYAAQQIAANSAAQHGNLDVLRRLEEQHILPTPQGANDAARDGHLDVLRWLEERHILPTQAGVNRAAQHGHLDVLRWLEERHILPTTVGTNLAAENGRLDVLQWLAERNILPDVLGANLSAGNGQLNVLQWLEERHILPNAHGANSAAREGHLNVLQWLEERHILPDDEGASWAADNGHLDVLQWLAERHILPS